MQESLLTRTGTPDIKRCSTDTILTDSFHFCRYLYTITIHGVWECSCNKIKHQNKGHGVWEWSCNKIKHQNKGHGVWEWSCNKIKHQNKGLFFVRYNESSSYACSKIHFLTLLIFLVFCVVLLCVFTFWVQCCDVHYDLRIKMMFGFVFTSSCL